MRAGGPDGKDGLETAKKSSDRRVAASPSLANALYCEIKMQAEGDVRAGGREG